MGGGGSGRNFSVISISGPGSLGGGGGGGSGRIFFPVAPGKHQSNSLTSGRFFFTFPGDLEITRHLWRLTQIAGDLAGLLTHSKNVTT